MDAHDPHEVSRDSPNITPSPRTLSLFSGAGGLDLGFSNVGFDIVGCVEIESVFCETLERNKEAFFSDKCKIFNTDVRLFDARSIEGDIEFIIGGPPCQTFSAIGRRAGGAKGIGDLRGTLFEEYCRIVKYFQPKGFLFENVRGIVSSNKGKDWQEIKQAFRDIGYQLDYKILNAADYGVPQKRERLIMVGTLDGHSFAFPRPVFGPDSTSGRPHISAIEAIADIQVHDEPIHEYDGKYGHLLKEIPPGQNYHHFTAEMGYPNPIFAWRSRFSDFLYKADPLEPVRTVVAKLGKYSGPFHWKNRRFTIEEMKRLQSFPDDYTIIGTDSEIKQQIGNSVPPIFAEYLARSVINTIFGAKIEIDLLEKDFKFSFDAAKGLRAKKTRRRRNEMPLFDNIVSSDNVISNDYVETHIFEYKNPKLRFPLSHPQAEALIVESSRKSHKCLIKLENMNRTCLVQKYYIEYRF